MIFSLLQNWLHLPFGITAAMAQVPCTGLSSAGIGCSAGSNQLVDLIAPIANLLITTAAGMSVLFVVVGGAQMIISFGDESMISKGKTTVIFALVGFAFTLSSQAIVSFIGARASNITFTDNPHIELMRQAVSVMLSLFNVAFALMIIYAGFRMVLGRGDSGEFDSAKKTIFWGVAGAIIINISYALIQATVNLGF